MVGNNHNRWTRDAIARLTEMRDARIPFAEVAREVGHPESSCRQMMTSIYNDRRREAAKETRRALKEAANPPAVPPTPSSVPLPQQPSARDLADFARSSATTAKLIAHAEMRDRIGTMGITGGLFGDPLPGRSALDKRNAACGGGTSGSTSSTGSR